MTKDKALNILKVLKMLKSQPQTSLTIEQLVETDDLVNRNELIDSLTFLIKSRAIRTVKGEMFFFVKDLDYGVLTELKINAGIEENNNTL